MPTKIIYGKPNETRNYDKDKFFKSLNRYGRVKQEDIDALLAEIPYDPLHYSVLIEAGVQLLDTDEAKRAYYDDHQIENGRFERLRRITGYLVGSLERWNDAKKAEEKARVKHGMGQYSQEAKDELEAKKQEQGSMLGKK